jgi:hypothetical protein
MTSWLLPMLAGCITDWPQPRTETSEAMIRELPATPAPSTPVTVTMPPGGGPAEVTMHQIRGTPAGTKVMVSGFLDVVEHGHAVISADSAGKTLHLRCEGGGSGEVANAVPHTPVRETGVVTDAVGDDTVVLTGCSTEVTGRPPIDLDHPRRIDDGA